MSLSFPDDTKRILKSNYPPLSCFWTCLGALNFLDVIIIIMIIGPSIFLSGYPAYGHTLVAGRVLTRQAAIPSRSYTDNHMHHIFTDLETHKLS